MPLHFFLNNNIYFIYNQCFKSLHFAKTAKKCKGTFKLSMKPGESGNILSNNQFIC